MSESKLKYNCEIVYSIGYWSIAKDVFKYMCENGYTDHKFEEWEEAEKKSVYDPTKGTTCPEKDALYDITDNWVKTFDDKGWMLVSVFPQNHKDEDGYYTKEYRNRYIYSKDASMSDILARKNYIAAFVEY